MKSHANTKHATAAKLRSNDSDGQQFLASIVVNEVEKKGVGALMVKNGSQMKGWSSWCTRNSGASSWQNTGGTSTKDRKGNKGSGDDVSNFSESDSDVESEEEKDEVEDDEEDGRRRMG